MSRCQGEKLKLLGQFLHYANENLPLLAFHGDISIPEKWRTAERLAGRYKTLKKPIHIYYFGDFDPKGLIIPLSAWHDIETWARALLINQGIKPEKLGEILHYYRIGINEEHIKQLAIPENPERPGTYQWEALDDDPAAYLIEQANELLDLGNALARVKEQEKEIAERLKAKLGYAWESK